MREKKGPARQAPRKKPAGSPEQAPATHSSQVVGTQVRCGTEKTANTPGIGHRVLVFLGSPAPSVFSTIPLPATPLTFCSSCPMSVCLRTSSTLSFLRGPARRMGRALELTGLCLDFFLDFVLVTERLVGAGHGQWDTASPQGTPGLWVDGSQGGECGVLSAPCPTSRRPFPLRSQRFEGTMNKHQMLYHWNKTANVPGTHFIQNFQGSLGQVSHQGHNGCFRVPGQLSSVDSQTEFGEKTVQNTRAAPAPKPGGLPPSFPAPPAAGGSGAPRSSPRLAEDRRKPRKQRGQ